MPTTHPRMNRGLPGRFDDLVRLMPPRAIADDTELDHVLDMIKRVLSRGKLTRGQEVYVETLMQLAESYENAHHAIDTSDISGIDMIRHLMEQHDMGASDLARVLGVHATMGSKILRGERSLTVGHIKTLAEHFGVEPGLFIDEK